VEIIVTDDDLRTSDIRRFVEIGVEINVAEDISNNRGRFPQIPQTKQSDNCSKVENIL